MLMEPRTTRHGTPETDPHDGSRPHGSVSHAAGGRSPFGYARLDDAGLLALVAAERDEAAFSEFFSRKARPVYSLIQRLVGDHGLADDAAQEAFVSVWRFARSYRRERGAVDAWLYTVARNAAYTAVHRRPLVAVADTPDRADPAPTPDEQVITEIESFRIHMAVERLPCREREIIERAYFKGMSQSEIAADIGVPLGTVKTRNRSALRHLADVLDEEPAENLAPLRRAAWNPISRGRR
jgi:RNA polymerase sigma-70 factor (ECF subfamily)